MCGIVGICSPSPLAGIKERLVSAGETIAHRGPDGDGIYLEEGCGLLHKRLSIIDLAGGKQPICNESGDLVLIFNGEIYNYRDLHKDLMERHNFATHSDSETILHQYEEGAETLSNLRGMFAFAIWNKRDASLFLMRDRVGIKPLYYAMTADGTIVFGSEMKALLATGLVKAEPDKLSMREYLAFKFTTGDRTFFKGIRRLEPGHFLRWRNGRIETGCYWSPEYQGVRMKQQEVQERFEHELRESLRYHLVSDVPVGAFLSGGLDSSAIVDISTSSLGRPISTYTCGTADETKGDLYYSRIVAQKCGSDHHEFIHDARQFSDFMKDCIWHLDEPGGGSTAIHGYYTAKRARQDVKVLLSGEGADEVLAGYYHHWLPHYRSLSLAGRALGYPKWKQWGGLASRGKHELLIPGRESAQDIFTWRHVSPFFSNPELYRTEFFRETQGYHTSASIAPYLARVQGLPVTTQLMYLDLKTYLSRILHIYDRMCMAVSLENRVPFLDHKFLEFTFSLCPDNLLYNLDTKSMLRKYLQRALGDEIAYRPKAGFSLPVDRWFRGELTAEIGSVLERFKKREILEPAQVDLLWQNFLAVGGDREDIWRLVSIEYWFSLFVD